MRRSSNRSEAPSRVEFHARQMRSWLTRSEERLWAEINAGKLGVCFRRQVPLGKFIADFVAPSVHLVIEVDGDYHARRRVADARRDRALARMGYRVLRLSDSLVEQNVDEAVARIRAALVESR